MSDGHRSGRSTGRVSCESTELKRCSMIEMRWNKYEVSLASPVWTQIRRGEFGNKVQSCGTEDVEIFYCYRLIIVVVVVVNACGVVQWGAGRRAVLGLCAWAPAQIVDDWRLHHHRLDAARCLAPERRLEPLLPTRNEPLQCNHYQYMSFIHHAGRNTVKIKTDRTDRLQSTQWFKLRIND